MSKGEAFRYEEIEAIARELAGRLARSCRSIEIAGSVRRKCMYCHDIDLVVWPIYHQQGQPDLFANRIKTIFEARRLAAAIGDLTGEGMRIKPNAKRVAFTYGGVPVDVYLATLDGANFGALMQLRTGPADFNVQLIALAKSKELEYRAGYGIFSCDQRVDDGTEEGVFRALGMRWVDPAHRGGYSVKAGSHAAR